MSRQRRLDFEGAIHLVRIRGGTGDNIFFDPAILSMPAAASDSSVPDLRRFQCLAWNIFAESGARIHGYSFEPDCGTWVLQVLGATLDAIMRRVCGEYSRYLHERRRMPKGQPVFRARYEAKVISPVYLPHAVRRVHRSPMQAGLSMHYGDYPFSSHHAYSGERTAFGLTTADFWAALARHGHTGRHVYREFMDREESIHVARLFERGSPVDKRVVGDKSYAANARRWAKEPRLAPSADQLILAVARIMERTPADIRAPSRTGVLGRALVAWYATCTGVTSLTEVGRWFSVSAVALRVGIRRYRSRADTAHLFRIPPEELFDRNTPR